MTRDQIQAAIDACAAAGGGVVTLPWGETTIPTGNPLIVNSECVRIEGSGWNQLAGAGNGTILTGTGTLIKFTGYAARGSQLRNIAFTQSLGAVPPDTGSWGPAVQDHAVVFENGACGIIENVHFPHCSQGIKLQTVGQMRVRNVRGWFLDNAIQSDDQQDVTHIDGVHAWPGWYYPAKKPVVLAQQARLTVLKLGRVDGLSARGIFGLNAKFGIHLLDMGAGIARGWHFDDVYFDFTNVGVYSQQAGGFGHINNYQFQGEDFSLAGSGAVIPYSAALILSSGGKVTIGKLVVDDSGWCPVQLDGAGNWAKFGFVEGNNWCVTNPAMPFFWINSATSSVVVLDGAAHILALGRDLVGGGGAVGYPALTYAT